MAIFLVDLQFREKAKNLLTSNEVFFVIIFLFLAMIPWIDIYNFVYEVAGGNVTKFWQDFTSDVHCNPKFAQMCPNPWKNTYKYEKIVQTYEEKKEIVFTSPKNQYEADTWLWKFFHFLWEPKKERKKLNSKTSNFGPDTSFCTYHVTT